MQSNVVRSTTGLCTGQDGSPLKTPSSVYCADTSNIRRRHSDILLSDHIHNLITSQPRTGWTYALIQNNRISAKYIDRKKMQNGDLQPVFSHSPRVGRHILQSFINGVVAAGKIARKCSQDFPGTNHYIPGLVFKLYFNNCYLLPGHLRYKAIFVTDGHSSISLVPSLKYILYITDKDRSVLRFAWMTQFCSKLLLQTSWIPTKSRCEMRPGVLINTKKCAT
jgi:hypothetical protein